MIWRWRGVGGRTGRSLSSCLFRTQVINLEGQKNDPRLNDLRFNLATTAVLTRTPRSSVPATRTSLLCQPLARRTYRGSGQLAPGGQHCTHALHVPDVPRTAPVPRAVPYTACSPYTYRVRTAYRGTPGDQRAQHLAVRARASPRADRPAHLAAHAQRQPEPARAACSKPLP